MRLAPLLVLAACTRPGAERALGDLEVGSATLGGVNVSVTGGMAAIRKLEDHRVELWASAPAFELTVFADVTSTGEWTIVANNVTPDAKLFPNSAAMIDRELGGRPTVATFRTTIHAGANVMRVAPVENGIAPFRVVAMADIQQALPQVHEVFEQISEVPDVKFVIGMGDITDRGEIAEYEEFERALLSLDVPFYSTIGNHELWGDSDRWWSRYGRMNFQFDYAGVAFTFVDSGDAGVDPIVEDWLDGWLASARDRTNVFLTHMPPIDPVGFRYGGFRSMRDAQRLLARLVENNVDLTLYGHIHTYSKFENAGIPAYISGGGGARPKVQFDNIDRHFLIIDFGPTIDVTVQRVD
jgi:predicted phosphodiesterase